MHGKSRKGYADSVFLYVIAAFMIAGLTLIGYVGERINFIEAQGQLEVLLDFQKTSSKSVAFFDSGGAFSNGVVLGSTGLPGEPEGFDSEMRNNLGLFDNYELSVWGVGPAGVGQPSAPMVNDYKNAGSIIKNYKKGTLPSVPVTLPLGDIKFSWPVKVLPEGSIKINSPFGEIRGSDRHDGIDIDYNGVEPNVYSIFPEKGVVDVALAGCTESKANCFNEPEGGWKEGDACLCNARAGNYVVIKHESGSRTFYAQYSHLDKVLVKKGDIVQKQAIGTIGNTGYTTGTHLDFRVYTMKADGSRNYVNPCIYLPNPPSTCSVGSLIVAKAIKNPVKMTVPSPGGRTRTIEVSVK